MFRQLLILATACSMMSMSTVAGAASVYDLHVKNIEGKDVDLGQYKNQVVLVVNTASQCGFTPQLNELQVLQEKYKDKKFTVIAFPSNDFKQNPEENAATQKFMQDGKYHVKFPIMDRIQVTGPNKHPLYQLMTSQKPQAINEVQWNFEKFLVGKDGKVIERWGSKVKPLDPMVTSAIDSALK